MKRTKEEYIALLDETVAYYSEVIDRRAVNCVGECYYITDEGKMCAIGRCAQNPLLLQKLMIGFDLNAYNVNPPVFQPQYQGFAELFWQNLQTLHDAPENWHSKGLTDIGQISYTDILNRINNGKYENLPGVL